MKDGSNYKEYLAGLMVGVSTVITGHPFDTVKESSSKFLKTSDEQTFKFFKGSSVQVILCPRSGSKGHSLIKQKVLTEFQENPKAAQDHMKNPMVMHKIQKLISAGIVQVK